MKRTFLSAALLFSAPLLIQAQRGGPPPGPPPAARVAAPADLTGYWVALVTNEWRWRMLPAEKGDYAVLPINNESRRVADSWDPARDAAGGERCRNYGAAVIMQVPARFHVTWENDNTMRMDVDSGMQTRLFRFGPSTPPAGPPDWQGYSVAEWQIARGRGREGAPQTSRTGGLKVVTTRMRPGYLRSNGVPYSGDAVVTEYYNLVPGPRDDYLNVTVVVEDKQYLTGPYVRSMQFKREPDGSKWHPEPC